MDPLIAALLVAMATNFTVELVGSLNFTRLSTRVLINLLTLPVSVGYHYLLGEQYPMLVVLSTASAFLSLAFGVIIEKVSTSAIEVRRGKRG